MRVESDWGVLSAEGGIPTADRLGRDYVLRDPQYFAYKNLCCIQACRPSPSQATLVYLLRRWRSLGVAPRALNGTLVRGARS